VEKCRDEMASAGLIVLYEARGGTYAHFPAFPRRQPFRVDYKKRRLYPGPNGEPADSLVGPRFERPQRVRARAGAGLVRADEERARKHNVGDPIRVKKEKEKENENEKKKEKGGAGPSQHASSPQVKPIQPSPPSSM